MKTWNKYDQQQKLRRIMNRAYSARLRAEAALDQGGVCVYCSRPFDLENPATFEHKIPVSKGGDDRKSNCAASCASCNNARGNANHDAFIRYQKRMKDLQLT